jgi:hypothetical protein
MNLECKYCENKATCFGMFDGEGPNAACNDCCDHSCEQGSCKPLTDVNLWDAYKSVCDSIDEDS